MSSCKKYWADACNKLDLVNSVVDIVGKVECAKYYMKHVRQAKIAEDSALRDFNLRNIGQLDEILGELSGLTDDLLDKCIKLHLTH